MRVAVGWSLRADGKLELNLAAVVPPKAAASHEPALVRPTSAPSGGAVASSQPASAVTSARVGDVGGAPVPVPPASARTAATRSSVRANAAARVAGKLLPGGVDGGNAIEYASANVLRVPLAELLSASAVTTPRGAHVLSRHLPSRAVNLNPHCLELYLSDPDFQQTFGMEREHFFKQPNWKQRELKKAAGLFT